MNKASFKDLTTFKTGGRIKYFFEVEDEIELEKAVSFAKKHKLPIFVIGEGSDILVSDKDYKGVVIKFVGEKINIQGATLTAQAGALWDKLVGRAVKENLYGIEYLSGIPGTSGAAPIQNIGAYGSELSDVFEKLRVFDIEKEKFSQMSKKDCEFGYRDSFFKKRENWQKYIITQISLKLNKVNKTNNVYQSLKNYLPKDPTLLDIRKAVLKVRSQKLEDWRKIPNAGSFFKNPAIDTRTKEKLEEVYPDIVVFPFGNKFKVSAGWLIEKTGWKGRALGSVKVSDRHALVIINPEGKGKSKDIVNLADKIKEDVYKKFEIKLEPEVQYINFD